MTISHDSGFLNQCIALALNSVKTGGGPFAALIVYAGEPIASACNSVIERCDPTAHAEIEAIRQASALLHKPHLTDCVLYASCEPCPMCLAAALWARIPRIVFAASHAEAERAGFIDTTIAMSLYGQELPRNLAGDCLQHLAAPNAAAPFDAWLAKPDRVPY